MLPRVASLLGVFVLLTSLALGRPDDSMAVEPPTPFQDIAGSMFVNDIAWLYQSGVTRGCSPTAYCPDEFVTRGQFASFLARAMDLPVSTRDFFKDDESSEFEVDINRVAAARVTRGCGDGRFCPDELITRDQMAALIVRARDINTSGRIDYFWDDTGSEHHWAINRFAAAGLTGGCGDGQYCPEDAVTRGQMAAFLHRVEQPAPRVTPAPTPSSSPSQAAPTATAQPTETAAATPKATTAPTVAPTTAPTTAPTAAPTVAPAPPSVPPVSGVAGYGAGTKGGAGGKVIAVTNLNDSGAGSLRAALDASGPRTVVFQVGGTIRLQSDLRVKDPFVTVDGSTAPSPVAIRDGMMLVVTHDVVLRHLRFRPGDQVAAPNEVDAVSINGLSNEVYNVVLDHVTMLWGPDIGGLSILGNVHDITVQYSIMGEGLYLSRHPEAVTSQDGHSMGASIFQLRTDVTWPKRLTFHHNLFTTSDQRMPVVQGAECVDLVNNVMYNWGNKGLHGNPRGMNVVNNWFRTGPETTSKLVYQWQHHSANPEPYGNSVYLAGNTADGFTAASEAPSGVLRSSAACGGISVNAESAQAGYNTVVGAAGATLPSRDAVDQRVIANLVNRGGTFFNGAGLGGSTPYWPY